MPLHIRHDVLNPVPVTVLGRPGIDRLFQGIKLGSALLREAILRMLHLSEQAGVRALVAHAINDEAIAFYTRYGLQVFTPETARIVLPVETIAGALPSRLPSMLPHPVQLSFLCFGSDQAVVCPIVAAALTGRGR